jgi:FkbM family methyltransferase
MAAKMTSIQSDMLMRQFQRRLRYQQAQPWQKPLLNLRRFVRNQFRKRGWRPITPGQLRRTDTFQMNNFTIVDGEKVSEQIFAYGIYEPALTGALLRLIRSGQVVVDVGMHIGYYTTLFACLVGERGEIHAFEPTPSTREIAFQNIRHFANITIHSEALWSSTATLEFQDFGIQWMAFNSFTAGPPAIDSPPPRLIEVPTTTLDQFRQKLSKIVSLVKIDAESAEAEILRGATHLLETDRPIVSLEVGDVEGKFPSKELVAWMQRAGYSPWEFRGNQFVRHSPKLVYGYDNIIFADAALDINKTASSFG